MDDVKRLPHRRLETVGHGDKQLSIYRIKLKGRLDESWSDWFDNMTLMPINDGETVLTGPIVDQPALHGILKKCRNLGLPILLVEQIEEDGM